MRIFCKGSHFFVPLTPSKVLSFENKKEKSFFFLYSAHLFVPLCPMRIAILNLMPLKEVTERDFLRIFGSMPHLVEIHWMRLRSHVPKHTSAEHMDALYEYFDELSEVPDGLIVTGAPVEQLDFEQVTYWPELCAIFDWARRSVKSTIYVCWAAQAGLYHHFGVPKYPLPSKKFGIFRQKLLVESPLFDGFGRELMMPHSRHTEIRRDDILAHPELTLAVDSDETGPSIVTACDGREIFITGHWEYATDTLDTEYRRDMQKGRTDVGLPLNYYPNDNPQNSPVDTWHEATLQFYRNWLERL